MQKQQSFGIALKICLLTVVRLSVDTPAVLCNLASMLRVVSVLARMTPKRKARWKIA